MFEGPISSADIPSPSFGSSPGRGSFAEAFSTLFGANRISGMSGQPVTPNGMIPFIGHCVVTVDANGGVRLPEFVRINLEHSGASLFVEIQDGSNCLIGSSICWPERVTREIREHHLRTKTATTHLSARKTRSIFGLCEEYLNPGETIRLPASARALAGIEGNALFIGAGETFEIWSLTTALQSTDPVLCALAQGAMAMETTPRR